MKKKCAFTICAKNYIGLAQILEESVKKYNDDVTYYIFVADFFEESICLPDNVIIAKDVLSLSPDRWNELSFKYDLTEFCTCVKPYCFKYLLENTDFSLFLYFDPDVLIFNSLDGIYDLLDDYSILLTPHVLDITKIDNGEKTEDGMRSSGMYNLGFLGLKRGSCMEQLLNWWGSRLEEFCFVDAIMSQFTDQKWMDFVPVYFSNSDCCIIRNRGLNLAPWNFYEREVINENGVLYVKTRGNVDDQLDKLIFVHYSGYDYQALLQGEIVQKNISVLPDYPDIRQILSLYMECLQNNVNIFDKYINQNYTYNFFQNGCSIDSFHRRLYHSLVLNDFLITDPFMTAKGSYYDMLRKEKLFTSDKNVNKYTKKNYPKTDFYLKKVNSLMKFILHVIGYKKYVLLLRLFRPYSRPESHIFLIAKAGKRNI